MAKRWTLLAESELRCEVSETEPLYLRLVEGSAELHGIELPLDKEFAFIDENFAVFTWYGCIIETTGGKSLYTSDSTPMVSYVNTHIQLEAMRDWRWERSRMDPAFLSWALRTLASLQWPESSWPMQLGWTGILCSWTWMLARVLLESLGVLVQCPWKSLP